MAKKDKEDNKGIEFSEIIGYMCPKMENGKQCSETAPAPSSDLVFTVKTSRSSMQNFHTAFVNAGDGAPLCPVHEIQMVPIIRGMNTTEESGDEDR